MFLCVYLVPEFYNLKDSSVRVATQRFIWKWQQVPEVHLRWCLQCESGTTRGGFLWQLAIWTCADRMKQEHYVDEMQMIFQSILLSGSTVQLISKLDVIWAVHFEWILRNPLKQWVFSGALAFWQVLQVVMEAVPSEKVVLITVPWRCLWRKKLARRCLASSKSTF